MFASRRTRFTIYMVSVRTFKVWTFYDCGRGSSDAPRECE